MPQHYTFDTPVNKDVSCILPQGFEGTNLTPDMLDPPTADSWFICSYDLWTPPLPGRSVPDYEERGMTVDTRTRAAFPIAVFPFVEDDGVSGFNFLSRNVTLDFSNVPDKAVNSNVVSLSVDIHTLRMNFADLYGISQIAVGGVAIGWQDPIEDQSLAAGPIAGTFFVFGVGQTEPSSTDWNLVSHGVAPVIAAPLPFSVYPPWESHAVTVPVNFNVSHETDGLKAAIVNAIANHAQMNLQVGLIWNEAVEPAFILRQNGIVTNYGSPLPIILNGSIDAVHITIEYGKAKDVALAHHPHGGYWLAESDDSGITIQRQSHADIPDAQSFSVAKGDNFAEPRLAVDPYSGLLACTFRGGTGKKAGQDNSAGGSLSHDDPFVQYRRFSFSDGETWTGDPPDDGGKPVPMQGMDGVKHLREVFNLGTGESLRFYNDAKDTDANGNLTGKGRIQVDIYDISNTKIDTFPNDGNGGMPGIGGLVADDSSFDALYIKDATTFLSCAFCVDGERKRFVSFDDGRTWTLDAPPTGGGQGGF